MAKPPKPSSKESQNTVVGGGLGGALATILAWVSKEFFGIDMPAHVAAAFALILIALGGWIGKRI